MSIIFHDPNTKSLVLYNKATRKICLTSNLPVSSSSLSQRSMNSGYSHDTSRCPHCGNVIRAQSNFVHENYFQLLQDISASRLEQEYSNSDSFIPFNIFAQGYYSTFFNELHVLGNGARGTVFKVEHILVENKLGVYALKKIPIGNDMSWLNKCIQEVKLMNSITQDCLHLVKYNHVWLEKSRPVGHVSTRYGFSKNTQVNGEVPYMFILQQFCPGGNLENAINEKVFHKLTGRETSAERKRIFKQKKSSSNQEINGLSTRQILSIISDLAHGLEELHSLDIIHRDLKPSNCLLLDLYDPDGHEDFPKVLIGDFGESQLRGQLRTATGATGTLEFTAPEVLIFEKGLESVQTESSVPQFTFKSDMYSLGMILYFIIFGELPFKSSMDMRFLKNQITNYACNPTTLRKKQKSSKLLQIDDRIFDLAAKLLAPFAASRPSAIETISIINDILRTENLHNGIETKINKNTKKHTKNKILLITIQFAFSIAFAKWYYLSHWNCLNLIILGASFNSTSNMRAYFIAIIITLFLIQNII